MEACMKNKLALLLSLCLTPIPGPHASAAGDMPAGRAAQFAASYKQEAEGDLRAAIHSLEELEAADYFVHLRLGWLNYRGETWNDSVSHYRKASKLAPQAVEPLLGLMLPLQAAGRFDEAIGAGQSILRLDPGNYTALSRMAWMRYSRKDYKKSASLYMRLVERYPADVEMLLGLGWSLTLDGRKKEASQIFQRVLLLSPGNPRAQTDL
ncbi:MAG: hypothetical protein A2X37_00355 [Elusimicrobia bacterium GWA2_66_18]|nr:MAG: hypothetical protein A2X37_00355 [Elusimicrobia bacterium GWA2_66_18]